MSGHVPTEADSAIRVCLRIKRSFALVAGAGSGKTASLVNALSDIREQSGRLLRQRGQKVVCVTYTKRAADVIRSRLGFDQLYQVSTLHSFLWGEIGRFHDDIRDAIVSDRIPKLITKAREKDSGRDTKEARNARERIARLERELGGVAGVSEFFYDDSGYSSYSEGLLSHDDVIEVSGYLLATRSALRIALGLRYPYIFVDEAQDTFPRIVDGLNLVCNGEGLPLVGYFGDPWQQIYEGRAGHFAPPANGQIITKTENFRCSKSVIRLLNAFRTDVQQSAAGDNKNVEGSVQICLVQAEKPEGRRNRYSDAQLEQALARMDSAIEAWGWTERNDVVRLFLVRQMIARRLGFSSLNELFTGQFASSRAQDDYEAGRHYLLSPFITVICPLLAAHQRGDSRKVIDLLRLSSPAFNINGPNSKKPLKFMIDNSKRHLNSLVEIWRNQRTRDVLAYCRDNALLNLPRRLQEHLDRPPRQEAYEDDKHAEDKGDWLADAFFCMPNDELESYSNFMLENTAYSTQHGVKGEQYPNVIVIYDDVEAGWYNYNFTKLLTPGTAGEPTDGQRDRGQKLAYVCFSRARENLRILLFTQNPEAAQQELVARKLFEQDQITLA